MHLKPQFSNHKWSQYNLLCLCDRVFLALVSPITLNGLPEGKTVPAGESCSMPKPKGVFLGLSGRLTCPCTALDSQVLFGQQ